MTRQSMITMQLPQRWQRMVIGGLIDRSNTQKRFSGQTCPLIRLSPSSRTLTSLIGSVSRTKIRSLKVRLFFGATAQALSIQMIASRVALATAGSYQHPHPLLRIQKGSRVFSKVMSLVNKASMASNCIFWAHLLL